MRPPTDIAAPLAGAPLLALFDVDGWVALPVPFATNAVSLESVAKEAETEVAFLQLANWVPVPSTKFTAEH